MDVLWHTKPNNRWDSSGQGVGRALADECASVGFTQRRLGRLQESRILPSRGVRRNSATCVVSQPTEVPGKVGQSTHRGGFAEKLRELSRLAPGALGPGPQLHPSFSMPRSAIPRYSTGWSSLFQFVAELEFVHKVHA